MTTQQLEPRRAATGAPPGRRTTRGRVVARRLVGVLVVAVPLLWAMGRTLSESTDLVNAGGLRLLDDLLGAALRPELGTDFLRVVLDASVTTVVFAAVGTAVAMVIGAVGGLVLSDTAWGGRPSAPVRLLRLGLRGLLVAVRSIHELVWALLLVGVLGLDPLVAVLAIGLPFGAQTAQVFGETLDGVPGRPLAALRVGGARPAPALAYALLPAASPLLLSYAFYRFECAMRSAVVLGIVGVGGLGQEIVVSLQSRNWGEVWTLIAALLVLSAVVDWWSSRLRGDLAVVTCADWSGGQQSGAGRDGGRSRWARATLVVAVVGLVVAWFASGVSWSGLVSARTRDQAARLADDLWPPALPGGGWSELVGGVADTLAMAVLAMAIAVGVTLVVGPVAARARPAPSDPTGPGRRALRRTAWAGARLLLLVLRSVPPTVWAVLALLALFPGILPGAVALGIYTGGILGRLVAEAWESIDTRPRDALLGSGVRRPVASLAAMVPPSAQHLVTYTLYRFEICVRDTAIVGVVGAAGLGRLLAENLAAFRYPVVTTLLLASFAVSVGSELVSRRLRAALRA